MQGRDVESPSVTSNDHRSWWDKKVTLVGHKDQSGELVTVFTALRTPRGTILEIYPVSWVPALEIWALESGA